jgi:hypothetical protein
MCRLSLNLAALTSWNPQGLLYVSTYTSFGVGVVNPLWTVATGAYTAKGIKNGKENLVPTKEI